MIKKVAFIGLGVMGYPIAGHLAAKGYDVSVFNRNRAKAEGWATEHKGIVGRLSRIGIYFLMIKFGASFGFAVMGRISLLIGQFNYLKDYSSSAYNYATPVILVFIIICLAIWSIMGDENKNESTA